MLIAFLITLIYLLVPGHPDLPGRGIPLGVSEIVLLAVIVTLWTWSRSAASTERTPWASILVIVVAAALKMTLAFASYPTGWLAQYYANDALQPPMERSTEFLPGAIGGRAAATRIDRRLDFRDTQFPVHFFNGTGSGTGLAAKSPIRSPFAGRGSSTPSTSSS